MEGQIQPKGLVFATCDLDCRKTQEKNLNYFFKDFIYIFLEVGREGQKEGEKHQCVVASHMPPTGGLACNSGTCPDWKSNQQPFGSQASTQSTEIHQPGQKSLNSLKKKLQEEEKMEGKPTD